MNQIKQNIDWLLRHPFQKTITRTNDVVIRRNELCPCGSGKKFKKCCLLNKKQPLTDLAKKEFEKERRSIIKNIKKKYKEKISEEL